MSQKRSDVWSHFTEINAEGAKCNICKKDISYKGNVVSIKNAFIILINF